MATYKLGSRGDEVKRIQEHLRTLGLYRGPIDGEFGGGTEAAVKLFQKRHSLVVDGQVGPVTWKALFGTAIVTPAITRKPLAYRCLALTGSFETGKGIPECFAGVSGDFDGQGLSFGALQWNFGQDSLQPLLKNMLTKHRALMKSIFQNHLPTLEAALKADKQELMAFVRSLQHSVEHYIYEPWKGMFKSLGRTAECQGIQTRHAEARFNAALKMCTEYALWSERAAALMFDINVQNGGIGAVVKARIKGEFAQLSNDLTADQKEVEKMRIIANYRAEAANPRWVEDVRARKLCCANGEGRVHGIQYDLGSQFGIRLKRH